MLAFLFCFFGSGWGKKIIRRPDKMKTDSQLSSVSHNCCDNSIKVHFSISPLRNLTRKPPLPSQEKVIQVNAPLERFQPLYGLLPFSPPLLSFFCASSFRHRTTQQTTPAGTAPRLLTIPGPVVTMHLFPVWGNITTVLHLHQWIMVAYLRKVRPPHGA